MPKRAWVRPRVALLGSVDEISTFVGSTKLSDAAAQKLSEITDAVASQEPLAAAHSKAR